MGDFRNLFLKISQLCCFLSQKFFVWVTLDFFFLCCQVMKMQPKDNTDHVPCYSSFLKLYTYIEFLFVVWGNRIGVFLALGLVCSSEDPETHNAVTPKTVIILIWVSQHCDVTFWEPKLWSSKSWTHSSKPKTSITVNLWAVRGRNWAVPWSYFQFIPTFSEGNNGIEILPFLLQEQLHEKMGIGFDWECLHPEQ